MHFFLFECCDLCLPGQFFVEVCYSIFAMLSWQFSFSAPWSGILARHLGIFLPHTWVFAPLTSHVKIFAVSFSPLVVFFFCWFEWCILASRVRLLTWSVDGTKLASAGYDDTMNIWSMGFTGHFEYKLTVRGHSKHNSLQTQLTPNTTQSHLSTW